MGKNRDGRRTGAAQTEKDQPAAAFPWATLLWPLLVASTLLAYLPALNGALLWDDNMHVTRPELSSLHGLWRIWFDLPATQQYYPLLHSAFWLEHRMWGDSVLGYHLINVALHAASACLLVIILRRLSVPGAWLAGFVFALHPVCAEAVAWVSEQKSTLSGFFYLASALTYLIFDRKRRKPLYFLALELFVLALMSKTVDDPSKALTKRTQAEKHYIAGLKALNLIIFGDTQGVGVLKRYAADEFQQCQLDSPSDGVPPLPETPGVNAGVGADAGTPGDASVPPSDAGTHIETLSLPQPHLEPPLSAPACIAACQALCERHRRDAPAVVGHFCSSSGDGWKACIAGSCNNRAFLNQ